MSKVQVLKSHNHSSLNSDSSTEFQTGSLALTQPEPTSSVVSTISDGSEDPCSPEERALLRKVDTRLIPLLIFLYLLSYLDRANLGNARISNLESDHSLEKVLRISPAQFSWSISIFFIGYILFEVPSNLMLKKATPSRWIARIMVSWGIFSTSLAAIHNFTDLLVLRFFLGVAEAGFFPGIIFYLTFWYRKNEQALRVAMFVSSVSMAGAFGGAIAYFISKMDGAMGLEGWRWIFIVEGVPSMVVGIATWFLLPNDPGSCSWLTPEERQLAVSRLDTLGIDETHFDMGQFKQVMTDWKVWLLGIIYMLLSIPIHSAAFFVPTIIKDLGYTSLHAQLMTVPPYIAAFCFTLINAWFSDRRRQRITHVVIPATLAAFAFLLLSLLSTPFYRYLCCFFMVATVFSTVPPFLTLITNNSQGSTHAASATGLIISIGNAGGIIGPQLYSIGAPDFLFGHRSCCVVLLVASVSLLAMRQYFHNVNKKVFRIHGVQGVSRAGTYVV